MKPINTLPDLHDGNLHMIALRDDSLILGCKTYDDKNIVLHLPNLVRLRVDDFKEGNIIYDVTFYCGEPQPKGMMALLFDGSSDDDFQKEVENICSGQWTILHVSSSYGCRIYALIGTPLNEIKWKTFDG